MYAGSANAPNGSFEVAEHLRLLHVSSRHSNIIYIHTIYI